MRYTLIIFKVVVGVIAVLAVLPVVTPWQGLYGRTAGYLAMMLFPGLAVYLSLARNRRLVESMLAALLLSPVLVGGAGALMMAFGVDGTSAARVLLLGSALATALTALMVDRDRWLQPPTPRQFWTLSGLVAIFCALAGYLPLSDPWWRYWSDAWFHGAVVHQMDTWGVPPEDPYFVGLDLQYMWMYHALVLMVSRGVDIAPLVVMPLLNVNALAGFGLSAYLVSMLFRNRFAYGILAVLFVVLAMNAVVWVFLPLKLVRALLGEVRGWAEVVRNYSVVPFDKDTVWTFLRFYNNQPFLLNKFIVSTALSLSLCFMGGFWYGCLAYMSRGQMHLLVLVSCAGIGMLCFHTIFGVIMIGALFASLVLLHVTRGRVRDYSAPRTAALAAAGVIAVVVSSPYLYSVLYLKETEKLIPIGLSAAKSGGILVSCALVIALAAFRMKELFKQRTSGASLFFFLAVTTFVICNFMRLPGINTYDKMPFFVHYPLAVIGSWVFADRLIRRHASGRYRRNVLAMMLFLLVPVNAFSWLAYNNTPTGDPLTASDNRLTEWVQSETRRDAIFFESNDRVLLLLTGPRRYYWGRAIYADNMG